MAAQVNKKFIIILSATLFAAFVGVAWVASTVFLKSASDLAGLGDAKMAEKDYKGAAELYSRAVNKEQSNVEYLNKWIDSLEKAIPNTPSEFGEYYGFYMAAHRQLALVSRGQFDIQRKYLDLFKSEIDGMEFNRGANDGMIRETESLLAHYQSPGSDALTDPKANVLRRYRGIAWVRIIERTPDLKPEVVERAREDLEAALAQDPDDVECAITLEGWHTIQASRLETAQKLDEAKAAREKAAQVIATLAQRRPGHPWVETYALRDELEATRQSLRGVTDLAQLRDATTAFRERTRTSIEKIASGILALPEGEATMALLSRLRAAEEIVDPTANGARTEEVVRALIVKRPDDAELLLLRADLLASRQAYDEAISQVQAVIDLPPKPVGAAGVRLFGLRTGARYLQALWAGKAWEHASVTGKDEATLTEAAKLAKAFREKFAAEERPDSPRLMLIDAMIALMDKQYAAANRLLDNYIRLTGGNDAEALWLGAQVAYNVQQTGRTKELLRQYMAVRPSDLRAMLSFADLCASLQQWSEAKAGYEAFLRLVPENQDVAQRLERVKVAMGEARSDNPVTQALIDADKMTRDLAGSPDAHTRIQDFLRQAAARHNQDPQLVTALAMAHMRVADREGALRAIEAGLAVHPDNAALKALKISAENPDRIAAQMALLDAQDMTPLDRVLTKYSITREAGRRDMMKDFRDEAARLGPDDPRVIEILFMDALEEKRFDDAQRITDRAQKDDLDRAQGRTFRARLMATQGNAAGAVTLMEEVVKAGGAAPEAWRLLGRMQQGMGRSVEAVRSYQEAMKLRPNDVPTIMDLLNAMISTGRLDDALKLARENERYARGNLDFVNVLLGLEADIGDKAKAPQRRQDIARAAPENRDNLMALAAHHMQLQQWTDARARIDQVRRLSDGLDAVSMDAAWHYAQKDVAKGRKVFDDYIAALDQTNLTSEPFMALAQFLYGQNDPEGAIAALAQGKSKQSPKTLEIDKATSDLLFQMGDWARALEASAAVVSGNADTAERLYQKRSAECQIRLGKFAEALETLNTVAAGRDPDAITLLLMADAKQGMGDPRGRKELLDRAVSKFPEDPTVFFRRGEMLLEDPKQYRDAVADFSRVVQLSPDNWFALRMRAQAHLQGGSLDDALRDLRQAARVAPRNDDLVYGLVRDMVAMGRTSEAIEVANDVIGRRQGEANALAAFGLVFYNAKQWAQAQTYLRRAFEADKNTAIVQRYLDSLLNAEPPDLVQAEIALKTVDDRVSSNPGLLMAYSKLRHGQGRSTDMAQFAIQAMRLLDQENPGQMLSWFNDMRRLLPEPGRLLTFIERTEQLGISPAWMAYFRGDLMTQQKADTALFEQGLGLFRSQLDATNRPIAMLSYRRLGSVLYADGKYPQADEVWRAGTTAFPNDVEMLNNLAYLLAKHQNKAQEALPLAEKAAQLNSSASEVLDTLGVVYTLLQNHDMAISALDRALMFAQTPQAVVQTSVHLATALQNAGRAEDAKVRIRMAIDTAEKAGDQISAGTRKELQDVRTQILGQ